jgi:NTE family protein
MDPDGSTEKIGVALSSGGAAGLAHIGVLEVLRANGIDIEFVAGTSAGAMIGAALASDRLDGLRDRFAAVNRRGLMRLFDPTWVSGGLFAGRRAMELVQPFVGERIEDLPRRFAAVATDLSTGAEVVMTAGSVIDAVRASIAIPGIFTPWVQNGRTLVDGALVDPIPVGVARQIGARFVLAVSVIPSAYAAPVISACQPPAPDGWLARSWRALGWADVMPMPNNECLDPAVEAVEQCSMAAVLARASIVVQAHIAAARLKQQPPDFLIQPDVSGIGVFDFDRAQEAVAAGRKAAEACLPALQRALAKAREGRRYPSVFRRRSVRQAA